MKKTNKILYIIIFFLTFLQSLQADIFLGAGNIERLNSGVTKDMNCQNYTIGVGGLLDTSGGGVLREVKKLLIDGEGNYSGGQIQELAAWVNNGSVSVGSPSSSIQFSTKCGPISVSGTSDTDGDGISDADEGDNAVGLGHGILLDQDGDGIYNFLDDDSDNDGISDVLEGTGDDDGDGIPNYIDYIEVNGSISVSKKGTFNDENNNGFADIGETISYEFNVTNIGNITLTDVNLSDDNAEVTGTSIAVLLVGESDSTSFTAVHTLTYQDMVDDKVSNQALVTAKDILDNNVSASSDDPANPVSSNDITITRFDVKAPEAVDDNVSAQVAGQSVEIDVVGNDSNGFFDLNASTVRIIDPSTGDKVTELVVPGEGTWSVDVETGKIRFVPEAGYVGDPTPIEYSIEDVQGTEVKAFLRIDYAPVATDDVKVDVPVGTLVTVDVLSNDKNTSQLFDPSTVVITDENGTVIGTSGAGKELVVSGEGVWTVHDDGTISFEPNDGFTGNPTPVYYKVQDSRGDFTNVAKISLKYVNVTPTPTPTPTPTGTPTPAHSPAPAEGSHVVIKSNAETSIDVLSNKKECQGDNVRLSVIEGGQVQGNAYPSGDEKQIIYQAYPYELTVSDYFFYQIHGGACDGDVERVDVDLECDSDEGISSNNGNAYNQGSLLLLMVLSMMIGLYMIRREDECSEII
jgi:CshA-type fibril repeat protein